MTDHEYRMLIECVLDTVLEREAWGEWWNNIIPGINMSPEEMMNYGKQEELLSLVVRCLDPSFS